jgi:hypothetical protein
VQVRISLYNSHLIRFINKIRPGSVKKINYGKLPFMQMENINHFLKAAQDIGVPKHDLFMSIDLYEGKNIPQVVQALYSLGSVVLNLPGYHGPMFGKKRVEKTEIKFSEEKLREARAQASLLSMGGNPIEVRTSISREVVKIKD